MAIYCNRCGVQLLEGSKICHACGAVSDPRETTDPASAKKPAVPGRLLAILSVVLGIVGMALAFHVISKMKLMDDRLPSDEFKDLKISTLWLILRYGLLSGAAAALAHLSAKKGYRNIISLIGRYAGSIGLVFYAMQHKFFTGKE